MSRRAVWVLDCGPRLSVRGVPHNARLSGVNMTQTAGRMVVKCCGFPITSQLEISNCLPVLLQKFLSSSSNVGGLFACQVECAGLGIKHKPTKELFDSGPFLGITRIQLLLGDRVLAIGMARSSWGGETWLWRAARTARSSRVPVGSSTAARMY